MRSFPALRRRLIARLSPGVTQRLRLLKWALTGPPPKADLGTSERASPDRAGPGRGAPATGPSVLPPGKTRLQQRRECVLTGVPANASILEIGPSHQPTLARRDGFNTKNADHLNRSGLIEKYQGHPGVDVSAIEDVDYVLTPGVPLATGIDERFDLVLASHVLEHSTSLIDFVNDCAGLLNPGGTLALILPDKRFCFDRFRERSSLGAVIDAATAKRRTHSVGALTEYALYATRRGGSIAWGPAQRGRYEWVHGFDTARDLVAASDDETYVDIHRWVFTPHHLRLLLRDLAELDHVGIHESFFHDTVGFEFFINLRADGPGCRLGRAELMTWADHEQRLSERPRFAV